MKTLDDYAISAMQSITSNEWNDDHIHECADLCYVISTMIEELLFRHPAIKKAWLEEDVESGRNNNGLLH